MPVHPYSTFYILKRLVEQQKAISSYPLQNIYTMQMGNLLFSLLRCVFKISGIVTSCFAVIRVHTFSKKDAGISQIHSSNSLLERTMEAECFKHKSCSVFVHMPTVIHWELFWKVNQDAHSVHSKVNLRLSVINMECLECLELNVVALHGNGRMSSAAIRRMHPEWSIFL